MSASSPGNGQYGGVLAGVKDKLAQIDATLQRQAAKTGLGMPAFTSISGRASAP